MKNRSRRYIWVVCMGLMLAGCQAVATPTPSAVDELLKQPAEVIPPDLSGEQPGEVSPLDWLREQPFEPAPPGWPEVITGGLPEGFEVQGPYDDVKELPSGEIIQFTGVEYLWPIGDKVDTGNWVEVYIIGSQSAEARFEFLDLMIDEDVRWEFEQLGGTQVLRYYGDWEDGRIWVSGAYMIWVFSYVEEERGPWVDTFAELYLSQPPVPGVDTPLDWLRAKPFEPAPSEQPVVITSGLPEGFEVIGPHLETGGLPSGETVEKNAVSYYMDMEDGVSVWVDVYVYNFEGATGRSEYLDILVAMGILPPERRDWGLEQYSGGEVARIGRYDRDRGRIWASGRSLVVIEIMTEELSPWKEIFTELYLAQYPAE